MKRASRLAVLCVFAFSIAACQTTPAAESTVSVKRGALALTVSGNGMVAPEQSSELTFGVAGVVLDVLVKEGQTVAQGTVIARLDPRELNLRIQEAEANLAQAKARRSQVEDGNATDEDRQAAQANIDAANAELTKTTDGPTVAADVAAADANIREAEANLEQVRSGNVTAADIANAQGRVREAEANLQRVRSGNVTSADIATAEAVVRNAEANLDRVRSGNVTEADITIAQANVDNARSRLNTVLAGPPPEQVSAAQTALTQAQQGRDSTSSDASARKTTAQQNTETAANNVRTAQEAYSKAFWDNDLAQQGIDPSSGNRFEDQPIRDQIKDAETRKREYADALRQAEIDLDQAQIALQDAEVAYENAKQQEINDVASAQAEVDHAQVELDELMKGPDQNDVTAAQSQVDVAQAQLDKLKQGGTSADVAAAQAQLDQANAQLAKLQEGVNPADIAAAQAQLDQANAQLAKISQGGSAADIKGAQAQLDEVRAQADKLQQGGAAADIAAAQAKVDEAKASYNKLSASGTASDWEIADAGIRQVDAQLAVARLNRDYATLVAPYSGIVTSVAVAPGDRVSPTGGASIPFTLIDVSRLHIDMSVSESDIGHVTVGQSAQIVLDALGPQAIDGKVAYIAPAGETVQGVTTYKARIDLPRSNLTRVAMNATVEIGVQGKTDTLIVPTRAIRADGDKFYVRLQRGSEFVDQEVTIGIANDFQTEVLSGVREGTVIAARGTPRDTSAGE